MSITLIQRDTSNGETLLESEFTDLPGLLNLCTTLSVTLPTLDGLEISGEEENQIQDLRKWFSDYISTAQGDAAEKAFADFFNACTPPLDLQELPAETRRFVGRLLFSNSPLTADDSDTMGEFLSLLIGLMDCLAESPDDPDPEHSIPDDEQEFFFQAANTLSLIVESLIELPAGMELAFSATPGELSPPGD